MKFFDAKRGTNGVDHLLIDNLPENIRRLICVAYLRSLESKFSGLTPVVDKIENNVYFSAYHLLPKSGNLTIAIEWGAMYSAVGFTLIHAANAEVDLVRQEKLLTQEDIENLREKILEEQNNSFLPLFVPIKNWSVAWRTADTVGLANTIYAEKRFDLCGILLDALQDAGCSEEEVFSALRSKYIYRGAWVLEQLR